MKNYELMVIVQPDIGIDAIEKRIENIRKLITSQGGEIFYEDIWGFRDFAYKIKKYDNGYYAIINFTIDGQQIAEIDKTLRLEKEVLRYMIVVLPKGYKPRSYTIDADENEEENKVVEKKTSPKKETKKKENKEKEEDKKSSIEEVDEKLKNIIDNPDLNF